MKILFVNYECPPLGGGGGVASFQLAMELAKQHTVDYLTMGFKGLPASEIQDNVHIIRVPVLNRKNMSTASMLSMLSFVPLAFFKGLIICNKQKYDCIHAFFVIPSGVCGYALSRIFHVPVIMTALGGDVYDPSKRRSPHRSRFIRILITALFNNADACTVESTNLKKIIQRYYPTNKLVQVIPLGFLQPVFPKVSRKDLKIPEDIVIFISVGRLVKRKGFEYSIRALSQISNYHFHYYILGDGPEETALKNLVSDHGLNNRVTFLGRVPDEVKFQYLEQADIYLLPSLHEGFGICLLEAMHCGLPIVSTNNGGQEDIIEDHRNALFTPVKDSTTMAERILELLKNPLLLEKIAANNRQDVTRFYIVEIGKAYEELYRKITLTTDSRGNL